LSEGEVPENVSRFYLKKKVIVGNTSKFIPTGTVSIAAIGRVFGSLTGPGQ
jgi:hypothetical protein